MQLSVNRRRTYHTKYDYLKLTVTSGSIRFRFDMTGNLSPSTYEYVEYSINDGKTWVRKDNVEGTAASLITPSITTGKSVLWRGKGTAIAISIDGNVYFSNFSKYTGTTGATFVASGDFRSMLYSDDFVGKTVPAYGLAGLFRNCTGLTAVEKLLSSGFTGTRCYGWMFNGCTDLVTPPPSIPACDMVDYCCYKMFEGCTSLTTAPTLQSTTLANNCYDRMFYNCTSLISAPNLPATTLKDFCYSTMFQGCTSLVNAPTISATTLATYCCSGMFRGCTSLTTTPTLSATTLATYCYRYMFEDCTSLVNVTTLPGTLKANCYQGMFKGCISLRTTPTLSKTTLQSSCYKEMFMNCSSLTTVTTLPATTLKANCYQDIFNGCTALTTAPVLPATTLVDSCYNGMFVNCSSLTYIKAMFTTTPSTSYTYNWVINVAATGIFIMNINAEWHVTGDSGVPTGWNIAYEAEYLQSTGTQYINTGITNTLNTELYVDFQLTGGTSEDRKIIGQGFKFGFGHYTGKWRIVDDAWYNTSVSTDTSRHVFSTDGGKYYLDSTLLADRYSHKAAGTYPMLLFAVSSQNSISPDGNCAKMKLYGCKIYEGNSLVRDFVPVAVDDGYNLIGYMYDKVSHSLFSNAGSGYFTTNIE